MTKFWPFRHLGLKALSVGLALLLWMIVAGEQVVERGLRVPLELQRLPAGLELQGELPTTIDVRVRGSSGALGRLTLGDVVVVLDLRGAEPGQHVFLVSPEQGRAPYGVEVVQVIPDTVVMTLVDKAAGRAPAPPPGGKQ
ncbi:MAG: CdaR family protein [Vicinamibacterales bacterium]